jgi:hypothetical protein
MRYRVGIALAWITVLIYGYLISHGFWKAYGLANAYPMAYGGAVWKYSDLLSFAKFWQIAAGLLPYVLVPILISTFLSGIDAIASVAGVFLLLTVYHFFSAFIFHYEGPFAGDIKHASRTLTAGMCVFVLVTLCVYAIAYLFRRRKVVSAS